MGLLFGKAKSTINEHIKNIYKEGECLENETMRKFGISEFSDKPTNFYNLDMIISIGYRVKSQNGIIFRKWANKILKDYLIKGYVINQKRLEYLEKTIKLIDIAAHNDNYNNDEATNIIKVINEYTKALNLLDDYDYKTIKKIRGNKNNLTITSEECNEIICKLKFNNNSSLFALERDNNFKSIIKDIYSTFDGNDLYPTIEEKCANVLYLIIKNHAFIDGNKRITATIFIYFLQRYNILYKNSKQIIV